MIVKINSVLGCVWLVYAYKSYASGDLDMLGYSLIMVALSGAAITLSVLSRDEK